MDVVDSPSSPIYLSVNPHTNQYYLLLDYPVSFDRYCSVLPKLLASLCEIMDPFKTNHFLADMGPIHAVLGVE